jgi:hypothetical protein
MGQKVVLLLLCFPKGSTKTMLELIPYPQWRLKQPLTSQEEAVVSRTVEEVRVGSTANGQELREVNRQMEQC